MHNQIKIGERQLIKITTEIWVDVFHEGSNEGYDKAKEELIERLKNGTADLDMEVADCKDIMESTKMPHEFFD